MKRHETLIYAITWVSLQNAVLSERRWSQKKTIWYDLIYMKHPKFASIYIGPGSRLALVEPWGQKGMGIDLWQVSFGGWNVLRIDSCTALWGVGYGFFCCLFCFVICLFVWPHHVACGVSVPSSFPIPQQWHLWVLTIRLPGNSLFSPMSCSLWVDI